MSLDGKDQAFVQKYAPRPDPLPIPAPNWNDAPTRCLEINEEWCSHVLGVMEAMAQDDTWIGEDDERFAAVQNTLEIMTALMLAEGCHDMACCDDIPEPILHRITADGEAQVSNDGGATWETDPNDPRITAVSQTPPVTSGISGTKCDAATNALENLKDLQTGFAAFLGTGLTIISLCIELIALIGIWWLSGGLAATVLIPIITGIVGAIASLTPTEYNALFTTDVWDAMLCILYCNIEEDGHFTDAGFSQVVADCMTKIPGGTSFASAAASLQSFIKTAGVIGLNNMAVGGAAADADCSDCECFEPCDPHSWDIIDGTDVVYGTDEDGDYVELTSVTDIPNTGAQGIYLTTGHSDVCCRVMAYDVISGHLGGALSGHCGDETPSVGHVGIPVPPDTANSILFYDLAVFRLRIHFAAPE